MCFESCFSFKLVNLFSILSHYVIFCHSFLSIILLLYCHIMVCIVPTKILYCAYLYKSLWDNDGFVFHVQNVMCSTCSTHNLVETNSWMRRCKRRKHTWTNTESNKRNTSVFTHQSSRSLLFFITRSQFSVTPPLWFVSSPLWSSSGEKREQWALFDSLVYP